MKRPRMARYRAAALVAVGVASWVPSGLVAQTCRGVPLTGHRLAVSGHMGFAEEADSRWGGELTARLAGRFASSVGYTRTGYNEVDYPGAAVQARTTLRLGLTHRTMAAGEREKVRLALCPTVGVGQDSYGEVDLLTLPVGVAVGVERRLGDGWHGGLHLEPRLVYTRGQVAGITESAISPGVGGGLTLSYRRLFVGASHTWVQAERVNRSTALHVGVWVGGQP